MSDDLPPPPIPPEADLRGLEWMPLYGHRLFSSDFDAHAGDAVFRAAVTLWWAAWNQVPAASLPDDDVALCRLAGLGRDVAAWRAVRVQALHGFERCADGRFYHRALVPIALESWQHRLRERARRQRWKDKAARRGEDGAEAMAGDVAGDVAATADRTRSDRTGADRTRSDRTGADRTRLHGASPDGTRSDGARLDGIRSDGARSDGPWSDAASPDSAGADRAGLDAPVPPTSERRTARVPRQARIDDLTLPAAMTAAMAAAGDGAAKRLKRQDVADRDMVRWLTSRGGMDGERAWALLMAARDPGGDGHTEAARELERISRRNRLGWFAQEDAGVPAGSA